MRGCFAGIACLAIVGISVPAQADAVAEFYKGKQVRLVVGSAVGGGYDLYARALARHMSRHIPGNPSIIVQNQAGAGSIVLANQLAVQGPKDGTVMGAPLNGIPTAPLLQGGTQFDPNALNWIGSLNREAYVGYVWHTVPVARITDLASKEVVVGATTVGATMVDYPLLLNELLGYKFKIVRGYQGPPQINLAIERGEVQGNGGLGWAVVKTLTQNWVEEKKIKILVQYNFQRSPELPDVPLATELARNDDERAAMRLVFARAEYSRPYFLPPDVPSDRVTAMRRAFDATAKDPALVADMEKQQLELSPMTGEELAALVADLAKTPANVVSRVKAALDVPASK